MEKIQNKTVKIIISGVVQGVGYRYFIARIADYLGIKGYVKNLFNGNVEILASGRKEFLEELIKKAKIGPPRSAVKSCQIEWLEIDNKYNNFEIL